MARGAGPRPALLAPLLGALLRGAGAEEQACAEGAGREAARKGPGDSPSLLQSRSVRRVAASAPAEKEKWAPPVASADVVVGMAVTGKEPYRARADMSKANWGRYFAVVDGFTYDDVPHAPWVRHVDKAFPEENTGRNHGLTLAMLQLMPSLHPEAKWFLFTDDDTFVVPHQLLRLATSLNSSEPFMTGRVYAYPPDHQVWFVCGGSGILASRAFAERLAPRALGCRRTYNWEDYSDSKVGSCARDVFEAEGGASEPYVQSRDDFWNRPLEEAGVSEGLLPENAVITMHIKDVNRSQDIFRFFEKDLTAGRDIRWGDVARAVKGFGSSLK